MHIIKRDGTTQLVDLNKIITRLTRLIKGQGHHDTDIIGIPLNIDPMVVALKVCNKLSDNITTDELDLYSAEICQLMIGEHYHYGMLADRLIISGHHKNTKKYDKFSLLTTEFYKAGFLHENYYKFVMANYEVIDKICNDNINNDYKILNYLAMKSLLKTYFMRVRGHEKSIIERYQYMLMRQALQIYLNDIDGAINCYKLMMEGYFTHASPTIYNSGTNIPQLSSCFLLGVHDSAHSMYQTLLNCTHISKLAGGIGMHLCNIRGKGAGIRRRTGKSSGLMPYIRVLNENVVHIDQEGLRKGSIAIYLPPWHKDIEEFIDAKLNNGAPELRARDLFYGLWVPDIFMNRVREALEYKQNTDCPDLENPVMWSTFCPSECPELLQKYGQEFTDLYIQYEKEKRYDKQFPILTIWNKIVRSQIETGTPYMCYSDSVNTKSAQKNIGIINNSNLCTEIMEYSSHEEYGSCNLASINLKAFVNMSIDNKDNIMYRDQNGDLHTQEQIDIKEEIYVPVKSLHYFDFEKLEQVAYQLTVNLNRVIDINYYPVKESSRSNFRHRPIGIGVQGLAETFIRMGYTFNSTEARTLNRLIFEAIYYGALKASNNLARSRTEKLQNLPIEDLHNLRTLASNIEYYTHYIKEYETGSRDNTTLTENRIINEYRHKLSKDSNDIYSLCEKYKLFEDTDIYNISEFAHMNLEHPEFYKYSGAYSSFINSPAYGGKLQYDLWNTVPDEQYISKFNDLKTDISKYGLRNSLLVAVMPTASTSLILGNTECIEPIAHNVYVKNTLNGSEIIYNSELLRILGENNLWNSHVKEQLLYNDGSIQNIPSIPKNIKDLFLIAFEIPNKVVIDMAADRSPYIDQSQSLNHYVSDVNKINSIHLYGHQRGLKTGSYYIRIRPNVNPIKFTVSEDKKDDKKDEKTENRDNKSRSSSENSSTNDSLNSSHNDYNMNMNNVKVCYRNDPTCEACSA